MTRLAPSEIDAPFVLPLLRPSDLRGFCTVSEPKKKAAL